MVDVSESQRIVLSLLPQNSSAMAFSIVTLVRLALLGMSFLILSYDAK